MKTPQNIKPVSSTLKVTAKENLVSEQELTKTQDKSLKDILNNEKKEE